MLIAGLLFTVECYSRVKSVLITKFGKSMEVAALMYNVQCFTTLPVAPNANSNRVH